jgi:hypothetical protein
MESCDELIDRRVIEAMVLVSNRFDVRFRFAEEY